MKKLAIILALLMVPAFAFGMDTISDSDLDAVTGQAGVSIALTSICIQNSAGTTSYGDADSDKWLAIVSSATLRSRTIGFHGKDGSFDALTIDIVDITDLNNEGFINLRTLVVANDLPETSNAAVKIELCDVIQIEEDTGLLRHIYMADDYDANGGGGGVAVTTGDMIISTYAAAGTTRIVGADMGPDSADIASSSANISSAYVQGENTAILISAHGSSE
jgi:hypothetical protein